MFIKNYKLLVIRFVITTTLIVGILALQPVKPVFASTSWYVATTGNDSNDCVTTSTPCATVNGAINKAANGDTIEVAIGTYTGSGMQVINIDKDITISGGWDTLFATQGGASTIDGQNARWGIAVNYGYNVNHTVSVNLDHLIVQNGYSSFGGGGGGIYNSGILFINNSAIKNNQNGGIYNYTGILTINNSTISDNYGGGVGNDEGNVTINNSAIYNNHASSGGGILNNGIMNIINTTISNNNASVGSPPYTNNGVGGGIYNSYGGSSLTLNNSTVSNNSSNYIGGGIYNIAFGVIKLQNSILANNIAANYSSDCNGSLVSLGNNIVGSSSNCALSSVSGDKFNINPGLGDFNSSAGYYPLLLGSPAIDAGDDATCAATDQRGVTRPQGGQCDIGAYERIIRYAKSNASGLNNGTSWTNAYTDLQSALSAASSGDEIWVAAGTYKPIATTDRTISFTLKNGVAIYGGFAGTETLRTQRNFTTNVTILSGEIGAAGVADNSYHVVVGGGTNNTAVLDGFTVTAGNANMSGLNDAGGGMYNSSGNPSLMNVTFSGNSALSGGGVFNYNSSPSLTNVIFNGNSAEDGGGMGNYTSSPSLTNVSFIANVANTSGGGMYNYTASSPSLMNVLFSGNAVGSVGGGMVNILNSSPSLTNVTFYNNSAIDFGGAIGYSGNSGGSPTLINVTLNANTASIGGGIYNGNNNLTIKNGILWGNTNGDLVNFNSSIPVVTYSIVQGGYAGTGNLSVDPLLQALANNGGFTQTMALGAGSPAIDAGDDANCPDTDQRGVTRPQGSHCDIGAYEVGSVDTTSPIVSSIVRANPNPTSATSVNFTVIFSESVTGVNIAPLSDFTLTTTGVTGAAITGVSGSGTTYTVTVNTGTGNGTIRLDVVDDDSIRDAANNPLGGVGVGNGDFTTGETYDIKQELILNGGFNTYPAGKKIPTSWKAVNFATSDGKTTTVKQEGTASVRIIGTGVSKTLSQTLLLNGLTGDAFTFSYWVKGSAIPTAGVCRAQILFYNGTTLNPIRKTVNCGNGTYAFKEKTLSFTAPGDYTKIVVRFTYSKASGRVWFDAVSLMK